MLPPTAGFIADLQACLDIINEELIRAGIDPKMCNLVRPLCAQIFRHGDIPTMDAVRVLAPHYMSEKTAHSYISAYIKSENFIVRVSPEDKRRKVITYGPKLEDLAYQIDARLKRSLDTELTANLLENLQLITGRP